MNTKTLKRWALVNKNSGKTRSSFSTREVARSYKRPTERIYDTENLVFVR